MKRPIRNSVSGTGLAIALLAFGTASAQSQKAQTIPQRNQAYDLGRETVLQGSVLTYTPASSVAPLGAHVTVQTASGAVDVHLGNAQLLAANHFSLSSGDKVRIVGENVVYGKSPQFLARLVQKGNQIVAVRSPRGFPLSPNGKFGPRTEGGAL
jgi:hypothetical protein